MLVSTTENIGLPAATFDLEQRVRQFFVSANLPSLRYLDVAVEGNTVVLMGYVQTFYEKQMATAFARRVAGVVNVVNSINVAN
jgi:osmotically-inducible protein OsmY